MICQEHLVVTDVVIGNSLLAFNYWFNKKLVFQYL